MVGERVVVNRADVFFLNQFTVECTGLKYSLVLALPLRSALLIFSAPLVSFA